MNERGLNTIAVHMVNVIAAVHDDGDGGGCDAFPPSEKSGKIVRALNNSKQTARDRDEPCLVFVQLIAEYLAMCLSKS
jgi:hypothetical protein